MVFQYKKVFRHWFISYLVPFSLFNVQNSWWNPREHGALRFRSALYIDTQVPTDNHAGIELARLADLPKDVLEESNSVASCLARLEAQRHDKSDSTKITARRKALLRVNHAPILTVHLTSSIRTYALLFEPASPATRASPWLLGTPYWRICSVYRAFPKRDCCSPRCQSLTSKLILTRRFVCT